jgi:hypothetical protein
MNWKAYRRRRRYWPNLRHHPDICPEGLKKINTKISGSSRRGHSVALKIFRLSDPSFLSTRCTKPAIKNAALSSGKRTRHHTNFGLVLEEDTF